MKSEQRMYQVRYVVEGQMQMMRVQAVDEAGARAAAVYAIEAIYAGKAGKIVEVEAQPDRKR
ncbi:MAG: hypothetical protein KJ063_02305 [Anaerolineae bacterium]|nr:hypothetical protein [Anaerolineae bacterium]